MRFEVERNAKGEAVRLVWRGGNGFVSKPIANLEPAKCPGCGYRAGWHALGCKQKRSGGA